MHKSKPELTKVTPVVKNSEKSTKCVQLLSIVMSLSPVGVLSTIFTSYADQIWH